MFSPLLLVCATLTLASINGAIETDQVAKDTVCCTQTENSICVLLDKCAENECNATLMTNKTTALDSFDCHTPKDDQQKFVSKKYDCKVRDSVLGQYKCEKGSDTDTNLPSRETGGGGSAPDGRDGWLALFQMLQNYADSEKEPQSTAQQKDNDKEVEDDDEMDEPEQSDSELLPVSDTVSKPVSTLARVSQLFKPVVAGVVNGSHSRPMFGASVIHVHTRVLRHEVIIHQEPSADAVARQEKQHLWGVLVIVLLVCACTGLLLAAIVSAVRHIQEASHNQRATVRLLHIKPREMI